MCKYTTFLHFSLNFRKDLCIHSQKVQINHSNIRDLNLKLPCVTGKIYAFRHVLELKKCCNAFKTCGQKTQPTFDDLSISRPLSARLTFGGNTCSAMIHPYCHCPFVTVQISPDAVKTSSAQTRPSPVRLLYIAH